MVDISKTGSIDKEAFITAMHLIKKRIGGAIIPSSPAIQIPSSTLSTTSVKNNVSSLIDFNSQQSTIPVPDNLKPKDVDLLNGFPLSTTLPKTLLPQLNSFPEPSLNGTSLFPQLNSFKPSSLKTRREPDSTQSGSSRDIFNEKPSKEESTVAAASNQKDVTTSCVLHTTFGDIYIQLYPDIAPKAVKKFIGYSKSGIFYYLLNNIRIL